MISHTVTEEDRVVNLLASLPGSFDMLVTTLEEQSENVPKWELVIERLLHEELKLREEAPTHTEEDRKALVANQKNSKRKNEAIHLPLLQEAWSLQERSQEVEKKQTASTAEGRESSGSDGEVLVTTHAPATTSRAWIWSYLPHVNNEDHFVELRQLKTPLGDGHSPEGTAEGTVKLETLLPDGSTTKCRMDNVPKLSYSLLSIYPKHLVLGKLRSSISLEAKF